MKVFISWSGEQSYALAEILRRWLPGVIQAVKPYFTPDDVTKGARWSTELAKELEDSMAGLICVTRDNLEAPWIMFEAGALSKSLDSSLVCPILFGVEPSDLKGPLVQFQAARFDKVEMHRVVKTINDALGNAALDTDILDSVFDMWWPRLKDGVEKELNTQRVRKECPMRSDRDILEEMLELMRSNVDTRSRSSFNPRSIDTLITAYEDLVEDTDNKGVIIPIYKSLEKLRKAIGEILPLLVPSEPGRKEYLRRFDQVNELLDTMDQVHRFQLEDAPGMHGAE